MFNDQKGLFDLIDESLIMNNLIWKQELFDPIINPIIDHCKYLLTHTLMKNKTNYLCLVGGLSESKYFQARIKEAFGDGSPFQLPIIIPKRPILSVVDGAARFGLIVDYIVERVLAKTYGLNTTCLLENAIWNNIPREHIEKNSYLCPYTYKDRVRNIFSVFVNVNQTIQIHQPITRQYSRMNINQKSVTFDIYCTLEIDPSVININCKKLASLTVEFPNNNDDLDCMCEFDFSDTTVRVFAYPLSKPDNKKEVILIYDYL